MSACSADGSGPPLDNSKILVCSIEKDGCAENVKTRVPIDGQKLLVFTNSVSNPRPDYHLVQFYRMNGKTEEALGLLLEAVRLDPDFADAHASLAEMYIVSGDSAAWRHARKAERNGVSGTVELLKRYGVAE